MLLLLRVLAAWAVARIDVRSERGASAVEYGVFVALIAAVIIFAAMFLGRETYRNFQCPTNRSSC